MFTISYKPKILLTLSFLLFGSIGAYYFLRYMKHSYPEPKRLTVPITQIDYILVEKTKRLIKFYNKNEPVRVYSIALGFDPIGTKLQEGDGRTPEGKYFINGKNPKSQFHLSLRISYPSPQDIEEAAKRGAPPGGDIMVHGLGKFFGWLGSKHTFKDWTLGCIAITNDEIDEIYPYIKIGTPIEINP